MRAARSMAAAAVAAGALGADQPAGAAGGANGPKPAGREVLVIGHRGASGYLPEHTLAAYELAIQQGADLIEPDLVITKDGVLVARHENEIGGTTDIASRPELASRRTTKRIDGVDVTGWFTEDLTLAELKTLRAEERIPHVRPGSAASDGRFEVPTLQEVIDLARASRTTDGEVVGIYPETKHPSYFRSLGLPLEEPLVRTLHRNGYRGPKAPAFIQSFETGNLRRLATMTQLPLVQLYGGATARPWGDARTYGELTTPAGLADVATYASGIGPAKDLVIPRTTSGALGAPTSLVRDAHAEGLVVHPYTFRRENQFLPAEHRSGADPIAPGDLVGELDAFLATGIDGFFTDNPDLGAKAVEA